MNENETKLTAKQEKFVDRNIRTDYHKDKHIIKLIQGLKIGKIIQ